MSAGRMASGNDAFYIQSFGLRKPMQVPGAVSDVIERPRPPAPWISHAPIFKTPGCNSSLVESSAQMANVRQPIRGAPIASVNDNRRWMRSRTLRKTQFSKLKFPRSIRDLFAALRRLKFKNALCRPGSHFQNRNSECEGAQEFTTCGMHRLSGVAYISRSSSSSVLNDSPVCQSRPRRPNEFLNATKLAPFHDDKISILIDRSAMRRVTNALLPLIRWQAEVCTLLLVRIVADPRRNVSLFIQHCHAPLQLREDGIIAANVHRRGHAKFLLNDFYEIPVEIPILDSIVVAVTDQQ